MQIVDDPNARKEETPQPVYNEPEQRRYYLTGLTLLVVGVLYLFDRATDWSFPLDFISWEWILIIVGIYIGEKQRFTGVAWIACITIGTWFLIADYLPALNLRLYFGPLVIIGIGLYLLLGQHRSFRRRYTSSRYATPHPNTNAAITSETADSDDYIDVVSIFGGTKKSLMTKQFKGGEAVSIFGGTEINLSQADFEGRAVLELTQIFGGCTLIIPPHWDLKRAEVVSIFGGVEDNRPVNNVAVDSRKVLILKGTSIFGGIDIKCY